MYFPKSDILLTPRNFAAPTDSFLKDDDSVFPKEEPSQNEDDDVFDLLADSTNEKTGITKSSGVPFDEDTPPQTPKKDQNYNFQSGRALDFYTPAITPHMKRIMKENCAPKFSPAPRFTPDPPQGSVLTTYKKEALSIVSATGTIVQRAARVIQQAPFTPMAHSTPLNTPRQSLGYVMKRRDRKMFPINDDCRQLPSIHGKHESFISMTSPVPSLNTPANMSQISEEMYVMKLEKLKLMILKAEHAVKESAKIIHDCAKKTNYNGNLTELSAQRATLIGRKKAACLQNEYVRTKTLKNMKVNIPRIHSEYLSSFTINEIQLELNRLFCFKKDQLDVNYAFCIVFSCANNVLGTQLGNVSDIGSERLRKVKFPDVIRFSKLPIDCVITAEVYAIEIGVRERTRMSKLKKSFRNLAFSIFKTTPKRKLAPIDENATVIQDDLLHPSNQINEKEFSLCGILRLNRDTLGLQRFYLDEAKFPLEGTISISSECSPLPQLIDVAFSGFLYVYSIEKDRLPPVKMWTIVKRSVLKFWNSAEDEYNGHSPTNVIDLSKVLLTKINKLQKEQLGYSTDAFSIDILIEPSVSLNSYQQKRIYFGAEGEADCENWLKYLNDVLYAIHAGIKEVLELEVANIPFNVSKKGLEVLFKGYKVNIAIKLGKNNRPTGVCNLVARKKADITKIMKDFKGVSIDKRVLKLTMKVNPKNVKQAKLAKSSVKMNTTKSVEDMDKELELYMNATV
uniref:PH domain-containing protein n=1 Tax=Rhabditophanes sp. KR3021 TaxID=114890 RepID=A0AC35TQQ9_9BILA